VELYHHLPIRPLDMAHDKHKGNFTF